MAASDSMRRLRPPAFGQGLSARLRRPDLGICTKSAFSSGVIHRRPRNFLCDVLAANLKKFRKDAG